MHENRRRALALSLIFLASCRGGDAGTQPGASAAPAPSASASASAPLRLFAGEAIFLRDVEVSLGRAGAPRELDVRAKVEVAPGKEGRVEIPIKITCRNGERRTVAFSKMISAQSDRFSLTRKGVADAYARAGTNVGWIDGTDACEVTFRLAPIGVAKQAVRAGEETVCWRDGAVVAGGCSFPPPAPPTARFEVHDLEAELSPARVEVHGHVKTRDPAPRRSAIGGEITCGDEQPTSEIDRLGDPAPFVVGAGESRTFSIQIARAGAREATRCTLALEWRAWNDDVSAEPVVLGKWCVNDTTITPGACAP